MASSGKKGKKMKWKALDITDNQTHLKKTSSSSWADEVDGDDYGRKVDSVVLPTAPRAARANEDDSKISHEPPFLAYLTNLPYEVNPEDLTNFFNDLKINVKIKQVFLPKDDRATKIKGFGYVEFEDRTSFVNVLNITDTTIKGRRMRIEVANHGDIRGGGRGMRGGGSEPEYMSQNWRTGPARREDDDGYRSGGRRGDFGGSGGGGFGRRDDRRGGYGDRDRERGGERGSGFSRDRGGGFGRDENREWQRGEGGGSSSNWRDGGDRERDRDREREGRGFGGRSNFEERRSDYSWRNRERDEGDRDRERGDRDREGPPPERLEAKSRPRLALQPRSTPIEGEKKEGDASASIFGGAKPVDTAAREREIEERLAKQSSSSTAAAADDIPKRKGPSSQDSWEKDKERYREKDRDRDSTYEGDRDRGGGGSSDDSQRNRQDSNDDREVRDGEKDYDSRGEEKSTPREEERRASEPPKENIWEKRAQQNSTVNNGRSSPLEESESQSKSRGTSPHPSREELPGGEPVRKYQPPRGQGPDSRRGPDRRGPIAAHDDRSRHPTSGGRDGGRPIGLGSGSAPHHPPGRSSNPPAKGSAPAPPRPREPKKDDKDDLSRMPKFQEQKAPNFAGSNKFTLLDEPSEAATN